MCQGSRLFLENVIRHLPGSEMDAYIQSLGAVVRILQSQLHSVNGRKCVRRSHKAIDVDIGGLGNENGSARSKLRGNRATFKHMFIRVESPLLPHICRGCTESHRDLERIPFLWPSFTQIHVDQFATVYRQAPSERTASWSRGNGAFRLRHAPLSPNWALSLIRPHSESDRLQSVETEGRLLGTPGTKTEPAFRQGVVFFRLRPGKAMYFRFTFSNSFSSEARNNLAQSMKIDAHSKEH